MDGVVPFDLQRLFVGDAPPLFLLEIVFRTVIVYGYALVLLRWLGSRTIGQLSTIEFLLVIALGSAIGDPMFYPEVPLVHALIVITVVVFANKGLDMLIASSKRVEIVIDGKAEEVIQEGVICKAFLASASMGTSELFQQLRSKGVDQLGQVTHAYIESDGDLTVFRRSVDDRPGLSIVPPWELSPPVETTSGERACLKCGTLSDIGGACPHCGHEKWTAAVRGGRFASTAD